MPWLPIDDVHHGNAPDLIERIEPESIALSVWSPPYHVGKSYEKDRSFDDWKSLLERTIAGHLSPTSWHSPIRSCRASRPRT